MDNIDRQKTLEMIKRMQLAKVGEYSKWESLLKKLNKGNNLNAKELKYFSSLTRIYKNYAVTYRSRIYHTRLSEHDPKPPCQLCKKESLFYCNINDVYYCMIHVVGHDENEL